MIFIFNGNLLPKRDKICFLEGLEMNVKFNFVTLKKHRLMSIHGDTVKPEMHSFNFPVVCTRFVCFLRLPFQVGQTHYLQCHKRFVGEWLRVRVIIAEISM